LWIWCSLIAELSARRAEVPIISAALMPSTFNKQTFSSGGAPSANELAWLNDSVVDE